MLLSIVVVQKKNTEQHAAEDAASRTEEKCIRVISFFRSPFLSLLRLLIFHLGIDYHHY